MMALLLMAVLTASAKNVQTESKTCRLVAEMPLSAVRQNPQEPAQTRGSRQKKANRLGLAFKVLVEPGSITFCPETRVNA